MAKFNTIPIKILRQLLVCDSVVGKLYWKHRPSNLFPKPRITNSWNKRFSGTEAFQAVNRNGYHSSTIFCKNYSAHRVIWALHYGFWPIEIDHINGIRTDNRIENLRDVSKVENARNQRIGTSNTSGIMGVSWHKEKNRKQGRWQVHIRNEGKQIKLGSFASKKDAIKCRKDAEIRFNYHPNHGKRHV